MCRDAFPRETEQDDWNESHPRSPSRLSLFRHRWVTDSKTHGSILRFRYDHVLVCSN
jgi:hypothetical protein